MLPVQLWENLLHVLGGQLLVFLVVVEDVFYVCHLGDDQDCLIQALNVYRSVHIESLARCRFEIFRWCRWFTFWVLGSCCYILFIGAVGALSRHSARRIVSSYNLAGRGKTTQIINNRDDAFNDSYALSSFDATIQLYIFDHLIQSGHNLIFEYLAYLGKVYKERSCLVQYKAYNVEQSTLGALSWSEVPNMLIWDAAHHASDKWAVV